MPKSRAPYPRSSGSGSLNWYARVARLNRSPSSSSRPRRPSATGWPRPTGTPGGARTALTTDEREELRRLRRENKTLREEREILKKAAAWFAKETGSISSKDSSS
jgi:transposase